MKRTRIPLLVVDQKVLSYFDLVNKSLAGQLYPHRETISKRRPAKQYSTEERERFARIRKRYGEPVRPKLDANGKIDITSVPIGRTFWATPHSGPLAGRHTLIARLPDDKAAIVGGASIVPGEKGSEFLHYASKITGEAAPSEAEKKEALKKKPEETEAVKKLRKQATKERKKIARAVDKLRKEVMESVGVAADKEARGKKLQAVKDSITKQLQEAGLEQDKIDSAVDLAVKRMQREMNTKAHAALGQAMEAIQAAKDKLDAGEKDVSIDTSKIAPEAPVDTTLSPDDIEKIKDADTPQEMQAAVHDVIDDKMHESETGQVDKEGENVVDLSTRGEAPEAEATKDVKQAQTAAERLTGALKESERLEKDIEDVKKKAAIAARQHGVDADVEEMRLEAVRVSNEDLLDMGLTKEDILGAAGHLKGSAHSQSREVNLYSALGKQWDDAETGEIARDHIAIGASTTLAGFIANFASGLGVPNLSKLASGFSPEIASYSLASWLHEHAEKEDLPFHNKVTGKDEVFSMAHYDQMINDITKWNRKNQSKAEDDAIAKLMEIHHKQSVLRDHMQSGQMAITDDMLEKMKEEGIDTKDALKIDTDGLRMRLASQVMDQKYLEDQAKLVGETIGGLQTAAGFLYAMKKIKSAREVGDDLNDMTISVGGYGLPEHEQQRIVRQKLKELELSPKDVKIKTGPHGASIHLRGEDVMSHVDRWVQDAHRNSETNRIKTDTTGIDESKNEYVGDPRTTPKGVTPSQAIVPQLSAKVDNKEFRLRGNQAQDIKWLMRSGGGVITRTTAAGKTLTGLGYLAARMAQPAYAEKGYRAVVSVPGGKVAEWVQEAAKFMDPSKMSTIAWKPKDPERPEKGFIEPKIPKDDIGHVIVEIPEHYTKRQVGQLLRKTAHLKHAIFVMQHQHTAEQRDYLKKNMGGKGLPPTGMVVDEPQELAKIKSGRMNVGKRVLDGIPAIHKVALTATPARENLMEAYNLVRWSARRPKLDEEGNPAYREVKYTHKKTGEERTKRVPQYERDVGEVTRKRARQPLPFIPPQIFEQLARGGTSAQQKVLNSVIEEQIGPWISGDSVKRVSFDVAKHNVDVQRTKAQADEQRKIESVQREVMAKHEAAAKRGGSITTKAGKLVSYTKSKDPAKRRASFKRAREEALEEITHLHRLNLNTTGAESNPKISSMVNNLVAELKGGSRVTHDESGQEQKQKIAGKRKKHIVVVSSPQQAAAVQDALDKAGIAHLSMATSLRDAKTGALTKDIKRGGTLKGSEVTARKEAWKADADHIDEDTGAFVEGANKVPVMIIDQNTSAGHNLQEADTLHVIGAPDDAATLLQAHGRAARDPRIADKLDIYTYKHTDSPHEHSQWDTLDMQTDMLRATSPGTVEDPKMMPAKRAEVQQEIMTAKEKAAELEKKPKGRKRKARKALFIRHDLLKGF